jgi:hypothetical protein
MTSTERLAVSLMAAKYLDKPPARWFVLDVMRRAILLGRAGAVGHAMNGLPY